VISIQTVFFENHLVYYKENRMEYNGTKGSFVFQWTPMWTMRQPRRRNRVYKTPHKAQLLHHTPNIYVATLRAHPWAAAPTRVPKWILATSVDYSFNLGDGNTPPRYQCR